MELRNMTLYSIFVRNHGGTFAAVEKDIPRIRALGRTRYGCCPFIPSGKRRARAHWVRLTPLRITGPSTRNTGRWRTSADWRIPSTAAE